ncbi:MAG: adenylyl-sulfate kinase [Euzebyales bacterium]|jgi:adenylylsulfate kinase|nr:adenylyl-sulfate kinase [Euzebyales bacterium]
MRAGYVLWFTGFSGAGKSTVAGLVGDELRRRGAPLELLDGDEVRTHLSKGLGFSREDRDTNILRIGWVAGLLSRHGVGVITAAISPYAQTRGQVRQMTTNFVEIFVDAPLAECARRDVKGLYAKAEAGDIATFTGVSDPYEPPAAPEIHLRTDQESPQESGAKVLAYLDERGWAQPTT